MDKSIHHSPLAFRATGLALKQRIFSRFTFKKPRIVPAALAVLVQSLSAVAVFLSVLAVGLFATMHFSTFSLVLMQALFAMGLCVLAGMASWWRWIHFGFPLGLWGMSMLHMPNEVYLVGFLISLSLYWTTFRSQVPFYPSRPIVWEKVSELIPSDKAIHMIDIGSGIGDLSMHIAKTKPYSQIEGIEIAPLPWLISLVRAYLKNSTAIFKFGDYHQLVFSRYDVVFAYLSPAAMPALWQKTQQEMCAGSLLISYEFDIPGIKPSFCIESVGKMPKIYVWKM